MARPPSAFITTIIITGTPGVGIASWRAAGDGRGAAFCGAGEPGAGIYPRQRPLVRALENPGPAAPCAGLPKVEQTEPGPLITCSGTKFVGLGCPPPWKKTKMQIRQPR